MRVQISPFAPIMHIILATILFCNLFGQFYQDNYLIEVVVQHRSTFMTRPLVGARVDVADLTAPLVDGLHVHYRSVTDTNGRTETKLPKGTEVSWSADPPVGYNYLHCHLESFNAGYDVLTGNRTYVVTFSGVCDGKGVY